MVSLKEQTSIVRVMGRLEEWDKGTKQFRKKVLEEFIDNHRNKTGPELEQECSLAASLFLTRFTAWLRLTYMTGVCTNELLRAITIFISATSGHRFMAEFIEVGGILTLLEIIGLKQAKEAEKLEALKCLYQISDSGRKYKELISESYGIRAVAECLAKSQREETKVACKNVLLSLSQGNPKFQNQVYNGLIALLPCSSPVAQQLACSALRTVQPVVGTANPAIVEPLLNLLRTLHLEIQFEAIELIKEIMNYGVSDQVLSGLVSLLRPTKEEPQARTFVYEEVQEIEKMKSSLPVFVQQAAAAKTIGILAKMSEDNVAKLIQLNVIHHLMYAMGNVDHADSQRQASVALAYFCRTISIVDDHVRESMGETLYDLFISNPETLYLNITHIQADVLVSNKVDLSKAIL